MTGGAAAYRKGRRCEYAVRDELRAKDYVVIRAYASIGPWDLLALRPDMDPLMVQVKAGLKPYMLPHDRGALIALAHKAGAIPVLAGYANSTYIFYRLVTIADKEDMQP